MIVASGKPLPQSELLNELEHSDYVFYLVGSRLLGTEEEGSDWDFAVNVGPGVDEFLNDRCHLLGGEAYWNTNTHKIFQQIEYGVKIQVSVCKDVQAKLHILRILGENPHLREFDKSLRDVKSADGCNHNARDDLWQSFYNLMTYDPAAHQTVIAEPVTEADESDYLDYDISF